MTQPQATLDDVDRLLLELLQQDARSSYAQLASSSGLSPAAVRVRIQDLHREGVVSTVGIVHPEILDIRVAATIGIGLTGEAAPVLEQLGKLPSTTFVVVTAGRFDIACDVMCRSDEDLAATLDAIRGIRGVRMIECAKHLDKVKSQTTAPHRALQVNGDLDELDVDLMRALELDGRATYADLAAQVGLSQAATRVRVQNLMATDSVRVVALIDPMALGVGELCGFGLRVSAKARDVAEKIAALPIAQLVAVTAGPWDVVGTFAAPSDEQTVDGLDAIRSIRGVQQLDSFAHLEIVKEAYPRLGAPARRRGSGSPRPAARQARPAKRSGR